MSTDTQANPTQTKASNFLANLNRFTARPEPTPPGSTNTNPPQADAEKRTAEASDQPTPTATLPPAPQAPPVPVTSQTPSPAAAKAKAAPEPQPQPQPQPAPKRRKTPPMPTATKPRRTAEPTPDRSTGTQLHRSFTVAPGTGTKVLTARVPRALHARLTLLATANKFEQTDDAEGQFTTVNAIVMDALADWLAKHDPQQQQQPAARSDAA